MRNTHVTIALCGAVKDPWVVYSAAIWLILGRIIIFHYTIK